MVTVGSWTTETVTLTVSGFVTGVAVVAEAFAAADTVMYPDIFTAVGDEARPIKRSEHFIVFFHARRRGMKSVPIGSGTPSP